MQVKEFISVLDSSTKWVVKDKDGDTVWWGQGNRYSSNDNYEIKSVQATSKGLKIFV